MRSVQVTAWLEASRALNYSVNKNAPKKKSYFSKKIRLEYQELQCEHRAALAARPSGGIKVLHCVC